MIAVTYAVFPVVLLGALAADGAWVPLAIGCGAAQHGSDSVGVGTLLLRDDSAGRCLEHDHGKGAFRIFALVDAFVRRPASRDNYLDLRPADRKIGRMHFGIHKKTFPKETTMNGNKIYFAFVCTWPDWRFPGRLRQSRHRAEDLQRLSTRRMDRSKSIIRRNGRPTGAEAKADIAWAKFTSGSSEIKVETNLVGSLMADIAKSEEYHHGRAGTMKIPLPWPSFTKQEKAVFEEDAGVKEQKPAIAKTNLQDAR